MSNQAPANEQTPLIAREPQETSEYSSSGLREDIDNALREDEAKKTPFEFIFKRPVAVMAALMALALLVIGLTTLSSLASSDLLKKAVNVPVIVPLSAELVSIKQHELELRSEATLTLDYSQLGESFLASCIQRAARKLGPVSVSFEGPWRLYMISDTEKRKHEPAVEPEPAREYLTSARVDETLSLSVTPDSTQRVSVTALLSEVGRPEALGRLVQAGLRNEPVKFLASGSAMTKKWGLGVPVNIQFEQEFVLPKETTDDLAEIANVTVRSNDQGSIEFSALANTSIPSNPLSASLPGLWWDLKIPGCNGEQAEYEHVCSGQNLPFALERGDDQVNIFFETIVDRIPEPLTAACDNDPFGKSPLDNFISKYLNGEGTTIRISGVPNKHQTPILNEFFTGYDIPYAIKGKESGEKLIKSVTLEKVKFAREQLRRGSSVETEAMSFSGRALVDIVLPRFLNLEDNTVLSVTGARGVIQLFDSNRKHFAQVLANQSSDSGDNWLQTISLARSGGYKVTCFFDNVPMDVTDSDSLAGVSREIFLRGHSRIFYDAVVDVRLETLAGEFETRHVRIKGKTDMYA